MFILLLLLRSCARGAAPGTTSEGGGRCLCFNRCYLFACTPPNSQIRNSIFVAQHRRRGDTSSPPCSWVVRSYAGSITEGTTSAGRGSRFVFHWCLFVACTTPQTSEMIFIFFLEPPQSLIRNSWNPIFQSSRSVAREIQPPQATLGGGEATDDAYGEYLVGDPRPPDQRTTPSTPPPQEKGGPQRPEGIKT